jgi:quinol monooxygenase YgiN
MAYVVTARWTAREGHEEDVKQSIVEMIEPTRAEPGNLFYQPAQDPENPRVFLILEIYADEDGYRAHGESEHFQRLAVQRAIPRLDSRERAFYETVGELS